MKNIQKWLIPVLVGVLLLTAIIFELVMSLEKTKFSKDGILATSIYSNYAWGFDLSGYAIMNDGSIYYWHVYDEDDYDDYSKNQYEWIIENGYEELKTVSDTDLYSLQKLVSKLEYEKFDTKNERMDSGSTVISVYKDGQKIDLKETGDNVGENKSSVANKIIKLVEKYI